MFISKETKELGRDMIDNCDNWEQHLHTYSNGKLHLWTANIPMLNLDSYPNTSIFNFFERIYIHKCIKKSKIKKAVK
jgi:hypothetical protein